MKMKFASLLVLLIAGELSAQLDPTKHSIALKTIRSLGDTPVAVQDEVKGGLHQVSYLPWEEQNSSILEVGMILTNDTDRSSYRYMGDLNSNGVNDSTDWQPIYIVTKFEKNRSYAADQIVIGKLDSKRETLFKTVVDIPAGQDSLQSLLKIGSITPLSPTISIDDQQEITVVDGGRTIISASSDYTLPEASTTAGETYTIKNSNQTILGSGVINLSNSALFLIIDPFTNYSIAAPYQVKITLPSGKFADNRNYLHLYKQNDSVTLFSDGESWQIIDRFRSEGATIYSTSPIGDDIDGIYYGERDQNGSWKVGTYRMVVYGVSTTRFQFQQKNSTNPIWINTTTH